VSVCGGLMNASTGTRLTNPLDPNSSYIGLLILATWAVAVSWVFVNLPSVGEEKHSGKDLHGLLTGRLRKWARILISSNFRNIIAAVAIFIIHCQGIVGGLKLCVLPSVLRPCFVEQAHDTAANAVRLATHSLCT
jgi:hypothetical protein